MDAGDCLRLEPEFLRQPLHNGRFRHVAPIMARPPIGLSGKRGWPRPAGATVFGEVCDLG